jgi:hypothetical protein
VLKKDKKALFNAMKEANKACEFLLIEAAVVNSITQCG